MVPAELIKLRLLNQQLQNTAFKKPEKLVAWMGAIQAQDYAGAKWAIGLRTRESTDQQIEHMISQGKIIRTHVLRPTWHFVSPADIRWMLMLTAPRIHSLCAFGYRKMELTETVFKRAHAVLVRTLEGNKQLTRTELATEFQKSNIKTNDLRFIHLMIHAELEGIVCNGARRNKQFTYALLDERVPRTPIIKREEALIKLTTRYFQSHGPATLQDYAWWSGLTIKDAQNGLEHIKSTLVSDVHADKTYWMTQQTSEIKNQSMVCLLPAFDEYTVAYKDRSLVLDAVAAKKTGNGIFKPLLVVDGIVKGYWKRNDKKGQERVNVTAFETLKNSQEKKMKDQIKKYSDFLAD